jgi:hypothetical protein
MSKETLRYSKKWPSVASMLLCGSLLVGACGGDAQPESSKPTTGAVEIPGCLNWQVDFETGAGQGDIRSAEIKTGEEGTLFDTVTISWRKDMPDTLLVDVGGIENGMPGTPDNPPEAVLDVTTPPFNIHAPNVDLTLAFTQEGRYPVLHVANCNAQDSAMPVAGPVA